jgi:peptidoglycan hydrolase-like protein with peptidoglycan-binding domain
MTTATLSSFPWSARGTRSIPSRPWQYLLRARGHSVAVDGIVGPVTWRALVSGMLSF